MTGCYGLNFSWTESMHYRSTLLRKLDCFFFLYRYFFSQWSCIHFSASVCKRPLFHLLKNFHNIFCIHISKLRCLQMHPFISYKNYFQKTSWSERKGIWWKNIYTIVKSAIIKFPPDLTKHQTQTKSLEFFLLLWVKDAIP